MTEVARKPAVVAPRASRARKRSRARIARAMRQPLTLWTPFLAILCFCLLQRLVHIWMIGFGDTRDLKSFYLGVIDDGSAFTHWTFSAVVMTINACFLAWLLLRAVHEWRSTLPERIKRLAVIAFMSVAVLGLQLTYVRASSTLSQIDNDAPLVSAQLSDEFTANRAAFDDYVRDYHAEVARYEKPGDRDYTIDSFPPAWQSLDTMRNKLRGASIVIKGITTQNARRDIYLIRVRRGIGDRSLEQGYAHLAHTPEQLSAELSAPPPQTAFSEYQKIADNWYLFQRRACDTGQ